jgi:hypothetical protein
MDLLVMRNVSERARMHRRWYLSGLILLFALLALSGAPARAQEGEHEPPPHLGYGISVGPHSRVSPALLDDLGLDWVKLYDLTQVENFPNQHVLYRIDVRGMPANLAIWRSDMVNLARDLNRLGVDAVEVGNEPNLYSEWGDQLPNARDYVTVLRLAYEIVHQYAPDVVVLAAGLAPTVTTADRHAVSDLEYAQQMLDAGAADYCDAFAYHAYGFDQPPEADPSQHELVFRRTERMYQLLQENGVVGRQIWVTEFGWMRDPVENGVDCRNEEIYQGHAWIAVPGALQAAWTARAFEFADSNWPWAGPMFLWNLDWNQYEIDYLPICSHMRWYAILDQDASPLPVYYAVRQVDKRPPMEYAPVVDAVTHSMTRTAEAGCAGVMRMGSFTIVNTGYPGDMAVTIEPANAPGRPVMWTSATTAESGDEVEVFVDATGIAPGLHMMVVNLRSVSGAEGEHVSTRAVRGWLLIHYPTSPQCVAAYRP